MSEVKMPEPEGRMPYPFGHIECYSEEEMKQYGDDRAREALDMAAKLCEWLNGEKRLTPMGCAEAIRALAKEIK